MRESQVEGSFFLLFCRNQMLLSVKSIKSGQHGKLQFQRFTLTLLLCQISLQMLKFVKLKLVKSLLVTNICLPFQPGQLSTIKLLSPNLIYSELRN